MDQGRIVKRRTGDSSIVEFRSVVKPTLASY